MKLSALVITAAMAALPAACLADSKDLGQRDSLRLSARAGGRGEYKVSIDVVNDEELAALDIPLKFGQPGDSIVLDRVEWSDRVKGWDYKHAGIDNRNKTVILGLISELLGARANADLNPAPAGDAGVAILVFKVGFGVVPKFEIFKTEDPGHDLTFIYNRYEGGNPYVEEFTPEFQVVAADK